MRVGKINVLVVDDDAISNFVTVRHLQQFPFIDRIHDFTDPVEALNYLKAESSLQKGLPDYIFLDINMPQLDGWLFLDRMYTMNILSPKVFLLTSSIYPEDAARSGNYILVNGFIVKPLDRKKIEFYLNID